MIQTKLERKEMTNIVSIQFQKERPRGAKGLYHRESDFLSEEAFSEILSFERKRSERSGKNLLLMLVDLRGIHAEAKYGLARHVGRTLTALNRKIHITGWYKRDSVLGTIFMETTEAEKEALREKVLNTIPVPFKEQAPNFRVVFGSFPGENGHVDHQAHFLFYPDVIRRQKKRRSSFFLKRVMDLAGGVAALFLFSPFFLFVPLLIKATSKGPVLFKQERVGRYGEKFVFLKFRTMSVDNDPKIHQEYIRNFIRKKKSYGSRNESLIYKIKDDPRVTRVGKLLRKTSLDELPQFFNVLKGEMSLVGPRPPIPYELENYDVWHRRRVMEIKPGITGLWQVEGRSSTTFDEMVRLDLKYAKEWSVWLDIKLLLKTPWTVIAGKGAY